MNRRDLIRLLFLSSAFPLCSCSSLPFLKNFEPSQPEGPPDQKTGRKEELGAQDFAETKSASVTSAPPSEIPNPILDDVRSKSLYFEQDFPEDVFFVGAKIERMKNLVQKFRYVQQRVGNGNFNLLGMDDFFRLARSQSEVTKEEKIFLEEVFNSDAKTYGFFGDKVFRNLTDSISINAVTKAPYTGHFLRRGASLETYKKIRKDVGDSLILTSGVRGLAKQFHLFFEKGLYSNGNMSKASRSLAPPGYSFHGREDFDVGRRGFGLSNFTEEFSNTDEFKKLLSLAYVESRYAHANTLGVRFEPWHIKIRKG